jgi:hypothetical protein
VHVGQRIRSREIGGKLGLQLPAHVLGPAGPKLQGLMLAPVDVRLQADQQLVGRRPINFNAVRGLFYLHRTLSSVRQ